MDHVDINLTTPSIPTTYSRLAARTLNLNEKNLGRMLFGTGISSKALLRDDTLLTGRQQIQILNNALEIAGDDAFGLYFGQKITPSTHGPLGFLVNSSPTLIDALEAFKDYLPVRMNLTQFTINRTERWLECHLLVSAGFTDKVHRLQMEALSLGIFAIAESILGRPLTEGQLKLSYPAPGYQQLYNKFYPGTVEFAAHENVLRIPARLGSTVNVSADHHNYEHALQQCRELLKHFKEDQHTTQTQVRRLLLSDPNHQMLEQDVAAALFVSKRTLARRLNDEATSFRAIRDEVLTSLAESYLLNTQLSVDAIASLLNYHDSSNFRRAFKRWLGTTPEQFRKRQHSISHTIS